MNKISFTLNSLVKYLTHYKTRKKVSKTGFDLNFVKVMVIEKIHSGLYPFFYMLSIKH